MSREVVDRLYSTYTYRFLAEGVTWRDLEDLRPRIKDVSQWAPEWSELARAAETRAERALEAGLRVTAGAELARASLYYFFAQFLLFDDPATKHRAYEQCVRTFAAAAPHFDPPFERFEIRYG